MTFGLILLSLLAAGVGTLMFAHSRSGTVRRVSDKANSSDGCGSYIASDGGSSDCSDGGGGGDGGGGCD